MRQSESCVQVETRVHSPCNSREVPSGTYFKMIFLRRCCSMPYSGDFSSYFSTAPLTSCTPPTPFCSSSTVSRLAYLSKNLYPDSQRICCWLWNVQQTYHPPGSATAARCAAATATSSSPFNDIARLHPRWPQPRCCSGRTCTVGKNNAYN